MASAMVVSAADFVTVRTGKHDERISRLEALVRYLHRSVSDMKKEYMRGKAEAKFRALTLQKKLKASQQLASRQHRDLVHMHGLICKTIEEITEQRKQDRMLVGYLTGLVSMALSGQAQGMPSHTAEQSPPLFHPPLPPPPTPPPAASIRGSPRDVRG